MWQNLPSKVFQFLSCDLRSMRSCIVLLKDYPTSVYLLLGGQLCLHAIQLLAMHISSDCLILIQQFKVDHTFEKSHQTQRRTFFGWRPGFAVGWPLSNHCLMTYKTHFSSAVTIRLRNGSDCCRENSDVQIVALCKRLSGDSWCVPKSLLWKHSRSILSGRKWLFGGSLIWRTIPHLKVLGQQESSLQGHHYQPLQVGQIVTGLSGQNCLI